MTLEDYFRYCSYDLPGKHAIDHAVRHECGSAPGVSFYIHPANTSGPTFNFLVKGNFLRTAAESGITKDIEMQMLREENRRLREVLGERVP